MNEVFKKYCLKVIISLRVVKEFFFRAEGGVAGWDNAVSEASDIYGKS